MEMNLSARAELEMAVAFNKHTDTFLVCRETGKGKTIRAHGPLEPSAVQPCVQILDHSYVEKIIK